jgi:hypothetical protein
MLAFQTRVFRHHPVLGDLRALLAILHAPCNRLGNVSFREQLRPRSIAPSSPNTPADRRLRRVQIDQVLIDESKLSGSHFIVKKSKITPVRMTQFLSGTSVTSMDTDFQIIHRNMICARFGNHAHHRKPCARDIFK